MSRGSGVRFQPAARTVLKNDSACSTSGASAMLPAAVIRQPGRERWVRQSDTVSAEISAAIPISSVRKR